MNGSAEGRLTAETVFLDRDGVINRKAPDGAYVADWAGIELLPGAVEGLRKLTDAGARLIITTNQRGLSRRLLDRSEVDALHARLVDQLSGAGARIEAVYVCPHEIGVCGCRKPEIGLFAHAKRDFPAIDFARSAVVGDALSDLQAAARIGARAYLVAAHDDSDLLERATQGGIRVDGVGATLLEVVEHHLIAT